jgi:hypothetical protein
MPLRAEMVGDGSRRRQRSLGLTRRLEPLQAACALTGRPMRVLTLVLERAMPAMSHPRQHLTFGGGVALELIRDDHPGHAWQPFGQLFEACLDRPLVATTLHQDVEDVIVLIHCPLQVMASARDGHNHLVELPMVSRPGPTTSPLIGGGWATCATPLTDRFVGHHDPTFA